MAGIVEFDEESSEWFDTQEEAIKNELLAAFVMLQELGPALK